MHPFLGCWLLEVVLLLLFVVLQDWLRLEGLGRELEVLPVQVDWLFGVLVEVANQRAPFLYARYLLCAKSLEVRLDLVEVEGQVLLNLP